MTEYTITTQLGDFLAGFESGKLTALQLPGSWRRKKKPSQLKTQEGSTGKKLLKELGDYLGGKRVKFTVPIALQGTEFQKRAWSTMRRIPWGRTISYGQLAEKLGSPRAARAAGSACGANDIVIINPCHRVLAADGRLGGFGSGLGWKKRLLQLEGHEL